MSWQLQILVTNKRCRSIAQSEYEHSETASLHQSRSLYSSAMLCSDGFVSQDYRLMAESLVTMGAADGEVNLDSFASDIERVIDRLGSMEAELDANAVIDERTGRVMYDASVNFDQEVRDEMSLVYRVLFCTTCPS